jgi:hypothetical protein
VIDLDVVDATSIDQGDVEDVIRTDQFEVLITFYREYINDEPNIEDIDVEVDNDLDDDTSGMTYTIN